MRCCHYEMVMVFFNGMKEMSIPIDRAGRIVLPKGVREELAIKPGDTLMISVHGSSLSLTPSRETTGFIRRGKALIFATAGGKSLSNETVNRLVDENRNERHAQSLAGFQGAGRSR